MKIAVGSGNNVKVEAVKELMDNYDFLKGAEVSSKAINSGVSDQPKSFDEIITGAKNRAKGVFEDVDLGFGIESGIVEMPHTKSGYMDFTCCVIFDGDKFHIGLSSGFEYPPATVKMVLEEDIDMNEAFFRAGLTEKKDIGSHEGGIGLLTKGQVKRKDYTKQSIQMALIHLQNKEHY